MHWSKDACSVIDTAYFAEARTDDNYRFIYLLLQYTDLTTHTAQTGVPGLNRDIAHGLAVRIPSLDHQTRIVRQGVKVAGGSSHTF